MTLSEDEAQFYIAQSRIFKPTLPDVLNPRPSIFLPGNPWKPLRKQEKPKINELV